jgi:alkylation response protein AidB-like acyl-CoA dehydrogenase
MDLALQPEHFRFHEELVRYLNSIDCEAAHLEYEEDPYRIRDAGKAFLRRLGADGWLGIDWPVESGGRGESSIYQWLFLEELSYRGLPWGGLTTTSIGPVIAKMGTTQQQAEFLTPILRGELLIAVGYSEADAGTDLAALRTRAVPDGDGYVISGAKLWTTTADTCTHVWLAARTGSVESRHRGVSIFLLPIDTPGITVRPIYTQGGERTNAVFYDEVRVGGSARIGQENRGWDAIVMQLNLERVFAHGDLRRELDRIVAWARETGALDSDELVRMTLARLAAELEVARLFSLRAALMIDEGRIPEAEASMGKVWFSELKQRIALECLDLLGPTGQFRGEAAPLGGQLERLYRASTVLKFAGGTNELQRDLIAARGLGLPR